MKLIRAWLKKLLGVRSPSAKQFGFDYMFDYLVARRKIDKAIRRAKHERL